MRLRVTTRLVQGQTKHAGGRPPKFNEPRRAITVTLPERTLRQLALIGKDRAKAIVKTVDFTSGIESDRKLVDVVEISPGKSIILVTPCEPLRQIPWLRLVEVSPRRALLTIPSGTPTESLEVTLMDLLENKEQMEEQDRLILEDLRSQIGAMRRGRKISRAEILFVDKGE